MVIPFTFPCHPPFSHLLIPLILRVWQSKGKGSSRQSRRFACWLRRLGFFGLLSAGWDTLSQKTVQVQNLFTENRTCMFLHVLVWSWFLHVLSQWIKPYFSLTSFARVCSLWRNSPTSSRDPTIQTLKDCMRSRSKEDI